MSRYDKTCFCAVCAHSSADIAFLHIARYTCISLHIYTSFGSFAQTEQGITLALMVTQEDMAIESMCTPPLWKRNQLLLVHQSIHLQSLDSFGSFFLGASLFTHRRVVDQVMATTFTSHLNDDTTK